MSFEEENDEPESKSYNNQLIADLKEQVERAEQASEHYRKQLEILQQRLDDSTDQQTAAEERDFSARTQIDKLAAEVKDSVRQRRDMEFMFESERNMLIQEKDRSVAREVELQSVVNRLTETLKTRSLERASNVRASQFDSDEDTPPAPARTSPAQKEEYLQVLQEKDATIDALKLDLADMHIKVAEQEHMGDGQLQTLEKQLSDIKMQNARLVEENDSFQMLLSEKTLKGDFLHDAHSDAGAASTLAEELETVGENDEVPIEMFRKVEAELKNVREEKKALTLYIDKIIGRLLQHEGFEHIITGKDDDDDEPGPMLPPKVKTKDKPLPLAPSAAVISDPSPAPETPTVMSGFLQRARSVVSRQAVPRQARPMSIVGPPSGANENPDSAPSIPINKTMGHRRARSDQMQTPDLGAAAVVQQMNKGSPLRTASGSPMGTGVISPLSRAQTSYFAPPTRSDTVRAPSQTGTADPSSSANSVSSEQSGDRQSTEATSAQASTHTRDHRENMAPPVTAGVMKQNQLRPLRLVQNQDAEEEARKKANRQSWMGNWFAKAGLEGNQ